MMAFITHCWKSAPLERPGLRARWVACTRALWGLLLAVALWPALALAQVPGEVVDMQIERQDERLLLSAALNFELPELVQDALQRGIPMYFGAGINYSGASTLTATRSYLLCTKPGGVNLVFHKDAEFDMLEEIQSSDPAALSRLMFTMSTISIGGLAKFNWVGFD